MKRNYKDREDDKVINKYVTYVAGIVVCLLFTVLVTAVVGIPLFLIEVMNGQGWQFLPILAFVAFGTCGTLLAFIFVGRIQVIPIGHRAALLFQEDYILDPWVLGVGKYWVPPFFRHEVVLANERIQNLPSTAQEAGFTVQTLKHGDAEGTAGQGTLLVRVVVRWRPSRIHDFLEFTEGKGDKKVEEGIRTITIPNTRLRAAGMTDEDFIKTADVVANGTETTTPEGVVVTEGVIDTLNKVAERYWGVEVMGVSIAKAEPTAAVMKARELNVVERNEREGEVSETDHYINLVDSLTKALMSGKGMTKKEARAKAIDIALLQTGKMQRIHISGDGGDFTRAAAITALATNKEG